MVVLLENLVERWDESLCQPEGEDKLGSCHEKLWGETLEETGHALVLGHVGDDAESRFVCLEVAVLNTGLDDIERGRYNQRSGCTSDGGDKVLGPGCGVVVGKLVEVFFGSSATTEEL